MRKEENEKIYSAEDLEELNNIMLKIRSKKITTSCTRLINEKYSNDQKKNFITMAWEIARADNTVDKHEEHRIRKLSELLYVDHKDFIKSKISTQ